MKAKKTKKFYAVQKGRRPGIYDTWKECSDQVTGHTGAVYKSFGTQLEASKFLKQNGYVNKPTESSIAATLKSYPPINASSKNGNRKEEKQGTSADGWIHIYTDGACKKNGTRFSRAGYGVYYGPNDPRNISEKLEGSVQTNNRAELTAVIKALENLQDQEKAKIYTDSQYVKKGLEQWIKKWKVNGWVTSSGTFVLNQDLWQKLDELYSKAKSRVEFIFVYGHSGNDGNEAADALAVQGASM